MHRRNEITLCSISYFFNVQQQNFLLYDFSLPENNQQCKAIQVNKDKLQIASKLEQALDITPEQLKLLEKKRRVFNFILPFKEPNIITTQLQQLIDQSDGLTANIESDKFFKLLNEHRELEKLTNENNLCQQLENFYTLLCKDLVREIYIICESQESLISRYPFCYQNIQYNFPNEILENKLYLGNSNHANNLKMLQLLGITHIVNCAKEIPNYFCDTKNDQHNQLIKYFQVPVLDLEEEEIADHFDEAYIFMNEALNIEGNKVLVHCAQGKSRSATIVLMFLMRNKQWTFEQSLEYAKKRRDIISINDGFQLQLLKL